MRKLSQIYILLAAVVVLAGIASAQNSNAENEKPKAKLIDEFGVLQVGEFEARVDGFLVAMQQHIDHTGYIIFYNSLSALPANREQAEQEREVLKFLTNRRLPRHQRMVFVRGGFRENAGMELWLIPFGADSPLPQNSQSEPELDIGKTFLFGIRSLSNQDDSLLYNTSESYEGDNLDVFLIPDVREKEGAERRKLSDDEDDSEQVIMAPELQNDRSETNFNFSRELNEEEKIIQKFPWLLGSFRHFLSENKTIDGVLIYYADAKRYNIEQLHNYMSDGISILQNELPNNNLRVIYGGYRHFPTVEYYSIPKGGTGPQAKPEVRPLETEN